VQNIRIYLETKVTIRRKLQKRNFAFSKKTKF
jgi:hypothetical protein